MKGLYISYYGNIYKIKGFSAWDEAVEVQLIKKLKEKLCSDPVHALDLAEGKMWTPKFFDKAKIVENVGLLYVSDT